MTPSSRDGAAWAAVWAGGNGGHRWGVSVGGIYGIAGSGCSARRAGVVGMRSVVGGAAVPRGWINGTWAVDGWVGVTELAGLARLAPPVARNRAITPTATSAPSATSPLSSAVWSLGAARGLLSRVDIVFSWRSAAVVRHAGWIVWSLRWSIGCFLESLTPRVRGTAHRSLCERWAGAVSLLLRVSAT
jgi:hypothetical protein